MTEGHGDDLYRYGGQVRHNFSSNIYTHVDHSELMRHLAGCEALLRVYPEPEPRALLAALAARDGVDPGDLLVTAGSVEAMYLTAAARPGARSAIVSPTFSEYADACRHAGHRVSHIRPDEAATVGADIIWICNPNNPDGHVWPRRELLELIDSRPETLFVVDAAYSRYTCQPTVESADACSRRNLTVLKSLTKDFAVPGLRIGYMAMPGSAGIDRDRLMPWRLNALAIEAAEWLLAHAGLYGVDAPALHSEALRMTAALRAMGMEVTDTDCNFMLARLPRGTAADLKERLVRDAGILIRDASNFTGLTPAHWRAAAQTPARNDLLLDRLALYMRS